MSDSTDISDAAVVENLAFELYHEDQWLGHSDPRWEPWQLPIRRRCWDKLSDETKSGHDDDGSEWSVEGKDYWRKQARAAIAAISASDALAPAAGQPLTIVYTNWRGETAERTIVPLRIWRGSTEWHPKPQWLITAWDVEKGAERDFAWNGIDFQGDGPTPFPRTTP